MSKSKTEQRMSESEKLLQFNSSGSETEEWNNLQGSKFRNSNLLPTYSRSETRRCHSTCMTSLPLDYSNRRQCQILGTLIVLTICIYFLLSKNLFQDDGMVLVRNQIIPQNFTTSPKPEIGPNVTKPSLPEYPDKSTENTTATSEYDEEEYGDTTPTPITEGCQIPKLNPFDPSILNISLEKFPGPKCLEKYAIIFKLEINEDGNSSLVMDKPPLDFGWKECCYQKVFKKSNTSDNGEKMSKKCYPISGNITRLDIPPTHEFIAIFCNSTSNSSQTHVMLDAFALTPLKPEVEKRVAQVYAKLNLTEEEAIQRGKLSLLVLGIDAVSHMNFQRTLPKLHAHLVQNLSAFWLDGYTKVGENTFPNLLVMLSNQTVAESKLTCSPKDSFDNCSIIWKHFSSLGYRTSFGEDSPWMGTFNYLKAGFLTQPTDYYLRPLARVAEDKISSDNRGNANICYGPRLSLQFLLQNAKSLAATMSSGGRRRAYFQFIWATSLTHDKANIGRMGEPHYLEFFTWMQLKGHLNSTVVVLVSDHGIRWGSIRGTRQGRIEGNLPFLYFIFPPAFRTRYTDALKNLKNNRNSLTTAFDTYHTFLDLAELSRIENSEITKRSSELAKNSSALPRGISLFLPIPLSRRCQDAAVEEHYCMCHSTQNRSISDPEVVQGANYAIYALNSKISKHSSKCAYLALKSVQYANQIKSATKSWDLSFSTMPGNGSFDATLVWGPVGNGTEKVWTVSGAISRTNLYGNQSYCMNMDAFHKYCGDNKKEAAFATNFRCFMLNV